MTKKLTYKEAGVNIDAGNESVKRIKSYVRSTFNNNVVTDVGLFGAGVSLKKFKNYKDPVLISSIDGVGTKLMIARMMNKWDTIGFDLINHSANDILCQGAKPLYFLDYLASSKLKPQIVEEIVKGLSKACRELNIALIGGETAEMPSVYNENEWDVVGCITGIVERNEIIDGSNIKENDLVIGLASNGLHTNGYSLARKLFFDILKKDVNDFVEELNTTVGEELLRPHKSYNSILRIKNKIKGIAHITGGGFIDNIPRILPKNLSVEINKGSWPISPIFKYIMEKGKVDEKEMFRTFNMGIGLVIIINEGDKKIINELENAYLIGRVVKGENIKFI